MSDARLDDWVVHRSNVVRSVAARIPGIDAEEAASRALEKMVRLVRSGGTIDEPAPYWRRAALNEAISMTREAGRTQPVLDATLVGIAPTVDGAELTTERSEDVRMLRSALATLADDDRQILVDRHVRDRPVHEIADDLGVRPHAVTMRLRRAEERLAAGFAAAHARQINEPECRLTRAAMHDYLKGRLLPRRQKRVETHMDGCADCTRAFIDVREVSWRLREQGQFLLAAGFLSGAVGGGVLGGGTTLAGSLAAFSRLRLPGKEGLVTTGTAVVVATVGTTVGLMLTQPADLEPVRAEHAQPGSAPVMPTVPGSAPRFSPAPPATPLPTGAPGTAGESPELTASRTTPLPPLVPSVEATPEDLVPVAPAAPSRSPTSNPTPDPAPNPTPNPTASVTRAVTASAPNDKGSAGWFLVAATHGATIVSVESTDTGYAFQMSGDWYVIPVSQDVMPKTAVLVTLEGPSYALAKLQRTALTGEAPAA